MKWIVFWENIQFQYWNKNKKEKLNRSGNMDFTIPEHSRNNNSQHLYNIFLCQELF